jgi:hypothetical protein
MVVAEPITAGPAPDAVALAESVAAVSDATAASVAAAGISVPVMTRPTSLVLNVPATPVSAVEELVLVTVTARGPSEPITAEFAVDAVALAERVAAVSDATAASVVAAGMPVPVMSRPTSLVVLNVPAAAVTAVELEVLETVTVRASVAPITAEFAVDVVAAAESVAAVLFVTAANVVEAGMPVPVMDRPTSLALNVPAAAVMAVDEFLVTVTVRASVVRPRDIRKSPKVPLPRVPAPKPATSGGPEK